MKTALIVVVLLSLALVVVMLEGSPPFAREQMTWRRLQWVLIIEHRDGVSIFYRVHKLVAHRSRLASPSYDEFPVETRLVRVNRDGTLVGCDVEMLRGFHPNYSAVVAQDDGLYTFDQYTGDRAPKVHRIALDPIDGSTITAEDLGTSPELLSKLKAQAELTKMTRDDLPANNVLFFDRTFEDVLARSDSNGIQIEARFETNSVSLIAVFTDRTIPIEKTVCEIDMSSHPYER